MIKKIARILLFPLRFVLRAVYFFAFPERKDMLKNVTQGSPVKIKPPCRVQNSSIGDYSYIAENSNIRRTSIGKFCSIGPNFISGWGIHPVDKISTSPVFYSKECQLGVSFSSSTKIQETKPVQIGNDVFIGMNVSILDGVIVGDGAVIAAGAVVVKNVEPYSIAGGVPARTLKYRFPENIRKDLLKLKWWDLTLDDLKAIEKDYDNVEKIIRTLGS